jgi:rfaE bifunctional protein nucleotidyltransferase chain/domain
MKIKLFNTIVISGSIGLIDAFFLNYLAQLKNNAEQLFIHVKDSFYAPFIPKNHIEELLSYINVVDRIIKNEIELKRIIEQETTKIEFFPIENLNRYSIERICKSINIEKGHVQKKSENNLEKIANRYLNIPKHRKQKVGLVSGSFDLIHLGHARYIQLARQYADIIIVATMSTLSIKQQPKNKDGDRPIYSQEDRVQFLSSIRGADHVIVFDDLNCLNIIKKLKPDVYIKKDKDMSRSIVKEECKLVESLGGEVVLATDDVGYSSSKIINHIRCFYKNQCLIQSLT